jgi:hypothetical protein
MYQITPVADLTWVDDFNDVKENNKNFVAKYG